MKTHSWKLSAFALATTGAVIYVFCALFDALFAPLRGDRVVSASEFRGRSVQSARRVDRPGNVHARRFRTRCRLWRRLGILE